MFIIHSFHKWLIHQNSSILLFLLMTHLFYSNDSLSNVVEVINKELKQLSIWFRVNKLSLNVTKTNFIIFGNKGEIFRKNPLPISIDGVQILQTSSAKFLGVIIDEKLTWVQHIQQIKLKISKNIGILCRLKHTLTKYALAMLL